MCVLPSGVAMGWERDGTDAFRLPVMSVWALQFPSEWHFQLLLSSQGNYVGWDSWVAALRGHNLIPHCLLVRLLFNHLFQTMNMWSPDQKMHTNNYVFSCWIYFTHSPTRLLPTSPEGETALRFTPCWVKQGRLWRNPCDVRVIIWLTT